MIYKVVAILHCVFGIMVHTADVIAEREHSSAGRAVRKLRNYNALRTVLDISVLYSLQNKLHGVTLYSDDNSE